MNIGEASRQSGLPAKTIRYYEEISLINPARRENGYRDYAAGDVGRLRFLRRARGLGFSIEECRQLLGLYADDHRASADVKAIAEARISGIDTKISELQALRESLKQLADHCHGDTRPDCAILEGLSR